MSDGTEEKGISGQEVAAEPKEVKEEAAVERAQASVGTREAPVEKPAETTAAEAVTEKQEPAPPARSSRIRVAPRGDFRRIKPGLRARVRPHAPSGDKTGTPGVAAETIEASGAEREAPQAERKFRDDRRPANVHELLGEHLKLRAESADPKLRAQLMGSLLIKFTSSGERFLFDWTTENLDMGFKEAANADCVMTISEQNMMRIVNGSLNPQIAILSDKISVSGRLSMAVYWFNLLAARGSAV